MADTSHYKFMPSLAGSRLGGFTLIELLVVLMIVAITSGGVALALRDSSYTDAHREGQRLAALLEAARAQSLMRGTAVRWVGTAQGFRWEGLPNNTPPQSWLRPDTLLAPTNVGTQQSPTATTTSATATATAILVLGPEPIIAAQSIALRVGTTWVEVASDGIRPFAVISTSQKPAFTQ